MRFYFGRFLEQGCNQNMTSVSRFRVRYAETDQMGVVYYGNYFVWMEIGRTDLLRELGLPYSEIEKQGVMLPVAKAFAKYVAPSFYDDEISVHSTVTRFTASRIRLDYRIMRDTASEGAQLVCVGYTEHAFISHETRKLIPVPAAIAERVRIPANAEDLMTRV
jgi:acyl-CoA thioester hydrolase